MSDAYFTRQQLVARNWSDLKRGGRSRIDGMVGYERLNPSLQRRASVDRSIRGVDRQRRTCITGRLRFIVVMDYFNLQSGELQSTSRRVSGSHYINPTAYPTPRTAPQR